MFSFLVDHGASLGTSSADYNLAYFRRSDVDISLAAVGAFHDYFHADEVSEFDRLPDKKRMDRLVGRYAAKRAILDFVSSVHGWSPRPNTIVIDNDDWGKPVIRFFDRDSPKAPHLSISHCPWGAAAVAGASAVGIDIEMIVPRPRSVIDFVSTPDEAASARTPGEQARLWTGKEAVLKLLGLGLEADARNIRINDGCPQLSGAPETAWRALGMPQLAVHFQNLGEAMMAVAYARGTHG